MIVKNGLKAGVVLLSLFAMANAAPPTTGSAGTLGKNDLITVTIADLIGPGVVTPVTVHVDENGRVPMPLLNKMVDVGSLTTDVAAERIAAAYEAGQIILHPIVSVAIVTPASDATVAPGSLRKGDKLDITIFDLVGPGSSHVTKAVIGEDGSVHLPLIQPVSLAGQSEADAVQTIGKAYKAASVLANPNIIVCRMG